MLRTLTLAIALLATAATVQAQEGFQTPVSIGVNTGVVAGSGPWRAAPSVDLSAAVGLGQSRFALVGGVGGWTFHGVGVASGQSEVIASIGAAVRGSLNQRWSWSVAAAPALAFVDEAQAPMAYRGGVMLSPTLQFSTRRTTLGLTLGSRAFVFSDGARISALAGVVYTFR